MNQPLRVLFFGLATLTFVFLSSTRVSASEINTDAPRIFSIKDGKVSPIKKTAAGVQKKTEESQKETAQENLTAPKKEETPYALLSNQWEMVRVVTWANNYEITDKNLSIQKLSDGFARPQFPAAIAAFVTDRNNGKEGETLTLMIAHDERPTKTEKNEATVAVKFENGQEISSDLIFDKSAKGGVTRVIINPETGNVLRIEMAMLGTLGSSAGVATPWGTFLTGESIVSEEGALNSRHGNLFELKPDAFRLGACFPLPISTEARINLSVGAIAIDEVAQCIYVGEAAPTGFLYRLKPRLWTQNGADLSAGMKVEVLGVDGFKPSFFDDKLQLNPASKLKYFWITLPEESFTSSDLHTVAAKAGAAPLGRFGGLANFKGRLIATFPEGGLDGKGGVIVLQGDTLRAWEGEKEVVSPGAIFYTSQGDLLLCEERENDSHLVFFTKSGSGFGAAQSLLICKKGSISGACVAGKKVFVNLRDEGVTLMLRQKE